MMGKVERRWIKWLIGLSLILFSTAVGSAREETIAFDLDDLKNHKEEEFKKALVANGAEYTCLIPNFDDETSICTWTVFPETGIITGGGEHDDRVVWQSSMSEGQIDEILFVHVSVVFTGGGGGGGDDTYAGTWQAELIKPVINVYLGRESELEEAYLAKGSGGSVDVTGTVTKPGGDGSFSLDISGKTKFEKQGANIGQLAFTERSLNASMSYLNEFSLTGDETAGDVLQVRGTVANEMAQDIPGASDTSGDIIVFEVNVPSVGVVVDATDPHNTKVNYQVTPGVTLSSATFTAPGKTETKTGLSGSFFFTYDQADLPEGNSIISLEYEVAGSPPMMVIIFATLTKYMAEDGGWEVMKVVFLPNTVPSRTVFHYLRETYYKVTYEVSSSGALEWGRKSTSTIWYYTSFVYQNMYTTNEYHRYRVGGSYVDQRDMNEIGPAGDPSYATSYQSLNDTWADDITEGLATCGNMWWKETVPPDHYAMFITNANVDRAMP